MLLLRLPDAASCAACARANNTPINNTRIEENAAVVWRSIIAAFSALKKDDGDAEVTVRVRVMVTVTVRATVRVTVRVTVMVTVTVVLP